MKREWLITARKRENLSQEELSNKINISPQMISAIELGTKRPSVDVAKNIAQILKFEWTMFYDRENDNLKVYKKKEINV